MSPPYRSLDAAIASSLAQLKHAGVPVDAGHWQGVSTVGKPDLMTTELLDLSFQAPMPETYEDAQRMIEPSSPWAELEHLERVGGEPHNPHHSLTHWPWWHGQTEATMTYSRHHEPGQFTHTYSERVWARRGKLLMKPERPWGIRYQYGDLNDLISLLRREPHTRQAYLPIFFPEDTGAVHGGRIPCTLGYHFMLRNQKLHLWYDIRSCDAVRHFRDDVYLAVRLTQWVIRQLVEAELGPDPWGRVVPGDLYFSAHSFHVHAGDRHLLP